MQAIETAPAARSAHAMAAALLLTSNAIPAVALRCPSCGNVLASLSYSALGQPHETLECRRCFFQLQQRGGIWQGLPKERRAYFDRFIREYEEVRRAEGRGSEREDFYLALPFRDTTGRNAWQWSIRARTYAHFERKILPALKSKTRRLLAILDLGAGNGWMSYRLASQGHWPTTVDLQSNTFDGLGAAIHYRSVLPKMFPRFQAELDRLPFEDEQFDCAIFNASFHYSENYDVTLAEAIRCLRPGGTVIIADSPYYSREESGRQMLEERRNNFQARFGLVSDALSSCEYLTEERLLGLEARHCIAWITHRVWYGASWACRPWIARLKGRREPSQFRIYTAQVKTR
jgi:SAM-dependent methyltransferase